MSLYQPGNKTGDIWHCGGKRRCKAYRLLPESTAGDEWHVVLLGECAKCGQEIMARHLCWVVPGGSIAVGPQHAIRQKERDHWRERIEREVTTPSPAIIGDFTKLISSPVDRVFKKVLSRF